MAISIRIAGVFTGPGQTIAIAEVSHNAERKCVNVHQFHLYHRMILLASTIHVANLIGLVKLNAVRRLMLLKCSLQHKIVVLH